VIHLDERLLANRLAFEARADPVFEAAWAGVHTLAQIFKVELDFLRGPSRSWRDFYADTAWRPLDLPTLLLEDLGLPDSEARERSEQALFMAAALEAAAVMVSELVQCGESYYGYEHSLLCQGLLVQAQWQLAQAGVDTAAVAAWSVAHWNEHGSAMLEQRSRRLQQTTPYTPQDLALLGRRWAPMKTAAFAAARLAGRPELVIALNPLLDEAAALYQLGRELGSLNRDLSRGLCSYPVSRLAQALGGQPSAAGPADADRAMLAAVLTPTLRVIAEQALTRSERLLADVRRLGLQQVQRALRPLAQPFEHLLALYAAAARPAPAEAPASFSLSHRPQRQQVIAAASGYLRSDPACHEAWEVYRCGYLNEPELVCRVFALGLLLEHRIAAGDDCGAEVDELFALYARNRFHYTDTPSSQPPDADTLGLMLRLAAHAGQPARCRALLEEPLGWLLASIDGDGDIPVFLTRALDADAAARYVPFVPPRCVAVQAAAQLGLLAFDAQRFRPALQASGPHTLRWFARVGAGALRCYDLPYGIGMVFALADGLRRTIGGTEIDAAAAAAEHEALTLLAAWRSRGRVCPQDAALLQLACRFPAAAALRDPAWIERLVRSQRHDGSWDDAPLYVVPSRGNLMNWYSSRMATTALAYHALRSTQSHTTDTTDTTGAMSHGRTT